MDAGAGEPALVRDSFEIFAPTRFMFLDSYVIGYHNSCSTRFSKIEHLEAQQRKHRARLLP